MKIASAIEHSLLKPDVEIGAIEQLCTEALLYQTAAVCIPPPFAKFAKGLLGGSGVKTATVVGFPFGYSAIEAKITETVLALVDGTDELNLVANISAIKNGDWSYLKQEAGTIIPMVHKKEKSIKIIIEAGLLTDDEIIRCCELYAELGADFVSTSTGFSAEGANLKMVQLMHTVLPSTVKILATGIFNDLEFTKQVLTAGADRLSGDSVLQLIKQQEPII